ncbi:glycosyltransferase family 25 protein [Hoeflea sp. G2-23]|uniref:Glycosyltransferase family 25 protein n=1 Tax=Hoeflea algicola TaxID=2983763 RepID=A0ABT3ZEL6_9HYPH|nr:glycosyltransferase family 25 protein [Hoeflea algicola]MCY0149676.1 glycosyltransferase family 25 protein [Hoeflea algicola]
MSTAGGIEAFVIHLARAEARRPQVERILAACPVAAEVMDAVDGRALTAAERDAVYSRQSLHAPRYPFDLTVGEIGCFLSHRRAWQTIVDRELSAGLIIEDDVEIDVESFGPGLDLAIQNIDALGYIQFQTRPVPGPAVELARLGGIAIIRPELGPLRTSAQLVSAAHAKHLLGLTERFDRPVDGILQMGWVTGKPLCCVVPSGISDRTGETGGSTISQKQRSLGNVPREINRFLYRRGIRKRSQRYAAAHGGER